MWIQCLEVCQQYAVSNFVPPPIPPLLVLGVIGSIHIMIEFLAASLCGDVGLAQCGEEYSWKPFLYGDN